jgi:uncharacterized membrane protein YdbT with pleckstrin-like domain
MRFADSLAEGEQVRLDLHPHWHQLLGPIVLLPVTVGLASYLFFLVPHGDLRVPLRWVITAATVGILVRWVALPWLRWSATRYVVTDRRVVVRGGLVRRRGRDIPLNRITDASFDCRLSERLFRCGTLTLESAGEHGRLVIADVPEVEAVQRLVFQLSDAEVVRHRA